MSSAVAELVDSRDSPRVVLVVGSVFLDILEETGRGEEGREGKGKEGRDERGGEGREGRGRERNEGMGGKGGEGGMGGMGGEGGEVGEWCSTWHSWSALLGVGRHLHPRSPLRVCTVHIMDAHTNHCRQWEITAPTSEEDHWKRDRIVCSIS